MLPRQLGIAFRHLDIRLAQDLCEARKDRCRSSFAISEKADREVRLSLSTASIILCANYDFEFSVIAAVLRLVIVAITQTEIPSES